ncbi:hypothetical protein BC827DRAFT_1379326 [Russula dissimulans]|nr:hypothetical protein BC827DRAFT_1379326 [Russula dissimulans]
MKHPSVAMPPTSPVSPPNFPSLMIGRRARSSNGFYSSLQEIATPTGSGSLSPISPSSSSLHPMNGVVSQKTSGRVPLTTSGPQNSDSDSLPSSISITTSLSYSYTVKSVNSRKSRLTVLYPRPVRSGHLSDVESISKPAGTSLESATPLLSRPISKSTSESLQGYLIPISNKQVADVTKILSVLFGPSPGNLSPVERRLSASWKSLLKIKAYEQTRITSNLRMTRIYADTLLCVHNEIVERHFVGARELSRSCVGLNKAFDDAYVLLSNQAIIPRVSEHIPALDASLFRSFVMTIMQLIRLLRALEVLVYTLANLAIVKASNVISRTNPDDDVIFNVPGWRPRQESQPTLPSSAAVQEGAIDSTLRLLLVTRNEELEEELRGLRFFLWRLNPSAKAKLGDVVKLTLPLHHEELMKSPVNDFVGDWQAAVAPSADGMND